MQLVPSVWGYAKSTIIRSGQDVSRSAEDEEVIQNLGFGSSPANARLQAQAQGQDLVLRQYTGPTLLPENLATLITACSLAARVSLRASALFIEAILEGLRYSSMTGLGLTRRALITAVSSARVLHEVQLSLGWKGDQNETSSNSAFLAVLDKYTSVGVYLIHHTFTLVELFTMSGFYFTTSGVSGAISAAEESVRLFDGIFGSTESSRALAAIVVMVKRELTQDFLPSSAKPSLFTSLAALTKALTAFACLQIATRRRSQELQKMVVLYDCTIVIESEVIEFEPTGSSARTGREDKRSDWLGSELLMSDVRSALEQGRHWNDGLSSPQRLGRQRESSYNSLNGNSFNQSRPLSMASFQEIQENLEDENEGEEIGYELERMIGTNEETEITSLHGEGEDALPEEVKKALQDLVSTSRVPQSIEFVSSETPTSPGRKGKHIDVVRSKTHNMYFEIETLTTTETKTIIRAITGPPQSSIPTLPTSSSTNDNVSAYNNRSISHQESISRSRSHCNTLNRNSMIEDTMQESEWVEVSSMYRDGSAQLGTKKDDDSTRQAIPEDPNGSSEIGNLGRIESLESPEQSKQRLQVVLKTMTKRLTARRRIVRQQQQLSPSRSSSPSRSTPPPRKSRLDVRQIEWPPDSAPNSSSETSPNTAALKTKRSTKFLKALNNVAKQSMNRSVSSQGTSRKASSNTVMPHSPGDTTPTNDSEASLVPHLPPKILPLPSKIFNKPLKRRLSNNSLHSVLTTRTHVETKTSPAEQEPKPDNFPHDHLARNLQRFCRYSSAAYGQAFMRILGIGAVRFNYPSTAQHANIHAFAHHTGLAVENIVLSSFTDPAVTFDNTKSPPLVHYVAVDHKAAAVVLTCRGTLGLQDILTDLTASYEPVELSHGDSNASYYAHAGMLHSANVLSTRKSIIHETVRKTLEEWPDYGLVIAGHSLGGGVAALLAILLSCPAPAFRKEAADNFLRTGTRPAYPKINTPFVTSFSSGLPPGRPLHAYTYGVPCVASLDLALYSHGLITAVVHNLDIVPSLSLGTMRDLKNVAASLWEEPKLAEEVVGRVIGLYQAKRGRSKLPPEKSGITSSPTEPPQVASLEELDEVDRSISLSPSEMAAGRGANRALQPGYRDPALVTHDMSEDEDLDWLWSLIKTLRAGNDSDKLYPPGNVYNVQWQTVFVSEAVDDPNSKAHASLRREGRRVILRHVQDVTARFSEPVFGRSMFGDHNPANYEAAMDTLAQAVLPPSS